MALNQSPRVWSRWTTDDEARLVELQARKDRVMSENLQPIVNLLTTGGIAASAAEYVLTRADAFVSALTPFCTEEHAQITRIEQAQSALSRAQAAQSPPAQG